jgi:general stress protein 26
MFFTNTESGKTDDLAADSAINIAFVDSSGQWASFSGRASVDTGRDTIRSHWTPMLKVWLGDLGDGKHDGGPDDPRIAAIRVKSDTITYSFYERGIVGRTAEIAKGAVTGDTPSFTTIRELSAAEIDQWRDANR